MEEKIKEMYHGDVRIGVYYNEYNNTTRIVADDLEISTKEKRKSTSSKIMILNGKLYKA